MYCSSRSESSSKRQPRRAGAADGAGCEETMAAVIGYLRAARSGMSARERPSALMPPSCRHPPPGGRCRGSALVLAAFLGHLRHLGLHLLERDEARLAGVDLVEVLVDLGHAGLGLVLRQLAVVVGVGGLESLFDLFLGLLDLGGTVLRED